MKLVYSNRDFDTFFNELKVKAQTVFPEWSDFNNSNIGVVFLELLAAAGDQSSYYLNQRINELFLPTVQRRRNAIKILNRMNYSLGIRVPASVDLTFSFEGGGTHGQDVTIPAGTQVKTEDGTYTFETLIDLVILAGVSSGVVSAKEWVTQEDNLEFDGTADQEKVLANTNYIQTDSVLINSVPWTEQTDLLDSGATDKHFKAEVDDQMEAYLMFGDGVNGEMPTGSGIATYKTGGGDEANSIQPGTITDVIDDIVDALSQPVDMVCTNVLSPSGGDVEETVDSARKAAPKASRTQEVTVSRPNYEGNAEAVAGVVRALAIGKQEDVSIEVGSVYVHIVPEGGGVPSGALRTAVEDYLTDEKPVMQSSFLSVANPEYKVVTITGAVIKKTGFQSADVKTAVDAALAAFFDYENLDDQNKYTVDFGEYKPILYLSSIVDTIMNTKISGISCVQSVTLTAPAANVAVAQKEIPELASLAGLTVT